MGSVLSNAGIIKQKTNRRIPTERATMSYWCKIKIINLREKQPMLSKCGTGEECRHREANVFMGV